MAKRKRGAPKSEKNVNAAKGGGHSKGKPAQGAGNKNASKQAASKKRGDANQVEIGRGESRYPGAKFAVPAHTPQGRRAGKDTVKPAMSDYIITVGTLARNEQMAALGEVNKLLNHRIDEWIRFSEETKAEVERIMDRHRRELGCDIEFRPLGTPAIIRIPTTGGGVTKRIVRALKGMDSAFIALKRAYSMDAIPIKKERDTGYDIILRARAVRATAKRIRQQIEALHKAEKLDMEALRSGVEEANAQVLSHSKRALPSCGDQGPGEGAVELDNPLPGSGVTRSAEGAEGVEAEVAPIAESTAGRRDGEDAGQEPETPSILKRVFGG